MGDDWVTNFQQHQEDIQSNPQWNTNFQQHQEGIQSPLQWNTNLQQQQERTSRGAGMHQELVPEVASLRPYRRRGGRGTS